ncbi:MAG: hypothetical protein WA661_16705, partial [Xanthobacteraceae bacterium]
SRENFTVVPGQDTVQVWTPVNIGYRDEFGLIHATFFILTFIGADGREQFEPQGIIEGRFRYAQNGATAY